VGGTHGELVSMLGVAGFPFVSPEPRVPGDAGRTVHHQGASTVISWNGLDRLPGWRPVFGALDEIVGGAKEGRPTGRVIDVRGVSGA
jgi:hypothetical protein